MDEKDSLMRICFVAVAIIYLTIFLEIAIVLVSISTHDLDEDVGEIELIINDYYYNARLSENDSLNVTFSFHLDRDESADPSEMFLFSFGDGIQIGAIDGSDLRHTYSHPGWHYTELTRTDDEGPEVVWSVGIPVAPTKNDLPVALVKIDRITVRFGDPFILSGEGSYDMDGGIIGYFWEYGDGTFDDKTNGVDGFVPEPERIHHYEKTGKYTAKMYVMDSKGNICQEPSDVEVMIVSPC